MQSRLKKHAHFLRHLSSANPKTRKALLQSADWDCLKCISECCHNICSGNVKLTSEQEARLHKHRNAVRKIASKTVPLNKKRELLQQKGGGIAAAIVGPIVAAFLLQALTGR